MKAYRLFFLILVSLTLFNPGTVAQDIKNMTLLGNFGRGEGEAKAVFAAGSIVYYGLGSKVQIASFSNPANPVKIGSVILSDVVEALVRTSIGGTQYIVASGGSKMWIINVANPTTPSLVSTVDVGLGATCEGIATSGTYAYIAAGDAGLKIYNIAIPAAPSPVASIDSLAYCESVVISAPYAYIAANTTSNFQGRSFIIDVSNPENPVYKSTILGYGGYHQYMNVRSGYAYICDYNEGGGVQVINVTDPSNPINVVEVPLGHRTACILFDGNYGYIAVGDTGMVVYNFVNPSLPVYTSKIKTTGRAAFVSYGAITISGIPTGHIFVANRNPAPGISAINVSNPTTPSTSAYLGALAAASGIAYTPFYSNGKVYVAYGSAGLRIIDVSFPSSPTLLSTLPLGGDSRAVVVNGNYVYVAARDSGVHIVDATNASSPIKIKTIITPRARGVAISGTILYVAASDSGMGLIDISDPTNALLILYTGSSVYGENVTANGNIVGLTDYDQITFYDATTPTALVKKGSTGPIKIGIYGNEGFAMDETYAYVPVSDSLKIFNIADLMTPTLVSKIWTGIDSYGYTSAVAGNYCYVASEKTGVRAINISNPAAPIEDGYYDFIAQSRGVTADGKYVYVAEKADGLTIYANDLVTSVLSENLSIPESITLHQNYPNPFNPTTQINVELKETAFVSLEIFNSLGQKVSLLLNDQLSAGRHNIPFDASSLVTGIYLYRLQANGVTITKKMLLLK